MPQTSARPSDASLSAELDRARAREAATREILEVISQSRDDEGPVFDAILRNATRLCAAQKAGLNLGRRGDTHIRMAAWTGWDDEARNPFVAAPIPMDASLSYTARSILGPEVIHLPDLANSQLYRDGFRAVRLMVDKAGVRSMLHDPLLLGDEAIGTISVHRYSPDPFTAQQIDLA